MDTDVKAWLLSALGPATDPGDLLVRYQRLGSARAVAIEVARERLAALRDQPASINVSSVVSLNTAENIKSYERLIAELVSGDYSPPAPDDPLPEDGGGGPNVLGTIRLIPRRRR